MGVGGAVQEAEDVVVRALDKGLGPIRLGQGVE